MAIAVTRPKGYSPKTPQKRPQTRRRGWATPYGFFDFSEPVTYLEALRHAKEIFEQVAKDLEDSQKD